MITTGSPPNRSRYLVVASYELDDLSISVSVLVDACRPVMAAMAPANDNTAARARVSSGRLLAAAVMRAKRLCIESKGYGGVRADGLPLQRPQPHNKRGFFFPSSPAPPPCAPAAAPLP